MTKFTVPATFMHHEDLVIGKAYTLNSRLITKDEIIAFARAFDPQPMHLDEAAARQTLAGGLCASGFHTCAILMRMLCDGLILKSASLGSPGVDEVRWLKPVRPGDVLHARYTCTEKRVLASRPHVGLSKITFEMLNDTGDVVSVWQSNQFLALRHPAPAAPRADNERAQKPDSAHRISLWDINDAPEPSRTSNYFEDRVVGEIADLGAHTFTRDEIIDFARNFDPQPFHLDEEAGRKSLFGGLSASGWHTASMYVRHMVVWRQAIEAEIRATGRQLAQWGPSPGFKDCRWLRPVLVGDTISYRNRTAALSPSKSRPDRGLVVSESQGRNQKGEIVFLMAGQVLVERKKA
jgi:acyl dehydratase